MRNDTTKRSNTNGIIEYLTDKSQAVDFLKEEEYEYFEEGTDAVYFANWTEEGLFFHAKAEGGNAYLLNKMWEMKGDVFKMLFPQFGLEYIYKSKDTAELSIKVWNMPRARFVNATSRERRILSRILRIEFFKFCEFIEYGAIDITD